MPYNTRRVSLSLTSMGIHVPGSNQNRSQIRSPPTSTTSTPTPAPNATPTSTSASADQPPQHPTKRVKRSHTLSSDLSAPSASTDLSTTTSHPTPSVQQQQQHRPAGPAPGNTPPPSPDDPTHLKIDKEGINDDVVVGVLEQLEATGNRPHLIKELAVILTNSLKVVESSANPTAIISSRLTNYLRRPWTALAQCPLVKEQVTVHPRRVYYYLSTCPRQAIPEYTDAIAAIPANGRIVSPSLSAGPDDDLQLTDLSPPAPVQELEYRRDREAMSPSPELDDFDLPSHYTAMPADAEPYNARGRVQSPPLEFDEREFSATACSMQALKRKQFEEAERQTQEQQDSSASSLSSASSSHDGPASGSGSPMDLASLTMSSGTFESAAAKAAEPFPTLTYSDESEESAALANHEAAAALFGQSTSHPSLHAAQTLGLSLHPVSSPMLRPLSVSSKMLDSTLAGTPRKTPAFGPLLTSEDVSMVDALGAPGWEMRNPEAIGLQELDDLLGGF